MKNLRASVKFVILLVALVVNLLAASKETEAKSHLLASPTRPMDQTEVERLLAEDNIYHNFNALRNLRIIGNTGSLAEDLKDFPYLVRLINRQGFERYFYRTEEEIIKMDLTKEGESASIKLYGVGTDALREKQYAMAIHYLLLSEMTGDPTAGSILEGIFENPASKGVDHLFKPSKTLAYIYKRRSKGFHELKLYKHDYSIGRPSRGSTTSAGSEHSDASTASAGSGGVSSINDVFALKKPTATT